MAQEKCGPTGFRVWQGYRSERYLDQRDKFIAKLGELFIPATVQMMEPLGLVGYFPVIFPDTNFRFPDEIALVLYPSQDKYYTATKETTSGRAYGALHGAVFNFSGEGDIPRSKSDFPVKYEGDIKLGQPYYLRDNVINWRDGNTKFYCAQRATHTSVADFKSHIESVIDSWSIQGSLGLGVDGSILVCEDDFILYWEHSEKLKSLFPYFAPVLNLPIFADKPLLRSVPELNTMPYSGMQETNCGDSYDIRLLETNSQTNYFTSNRFKVVNS